MTLLVGGGCGDDPFRPALRYRMTGLSPAGGGACDGAPTGAPPAIPGATRARLTYLDGEDRSLRCDVVLDLAAPPTVISVPDAARPVDLVVEYVDDDGAVLGRGEATAIDLAGAGEVVVQIAPAGAFACAPDVAVAPRAFHSATPLPGGDLLLIGGVAGAGGAAAIDPAAGLFVQPAVEIYDPRRGEARPVSIAGLVPRAFHEAYVVASDDDGVTIAVLGGMTVSGDPAATPVAVVGTRWRIDPSPAAIGAPGELIRYDRATASFSRTAIGAGFDVEPRAFGALTPPGAPAIAAAGGLPFAAEPAPPVVTADRIDVTTGLRTTTVALRRPRIGATVTPLDATRLLVWGGDPDAGEVGGTPELGELLAAWDGTPVAQGLAIAAEGDQGPHRAFGAAAVAGDGAVIVGGGFALGAGPDVVPVDPVVQRIDEAAGAWTVTTLLAAPLGAPAGYGAAVRLPDGDVLLAGGNPEPVAAGCPTTDQGLACAIGAAWRYDSATATLAATGPLGVPRYGLRLTALSDGTVAASGGLAAAGGALRAAVDLELYEPRGAADDPLLPAITRAPGDVARTDAGEPLAPCDVVVTYDDAGP